jgi:hypothetical protein
MAKRAVRFAFVVGIAALGLAAPALAQDVDRIDRITGSVSPGGGFRPPEGVKVVSPGALVFASFDRNFDGRISGEEIAAGAAGVFQAADRNKDGSITGFEQTDWANNVGDPTGVLANAMTFDVDLDRTVTLAEFTSGLVRLAGQISTDPSKELTFSDLVQPLNRTPEPGAPAPGGWGKITPRGSPPRDTGGR